MVDIGGFLICIFCGILMLIFHEMGHYLWDVLVTKVPSRFVVKRVYGLPSFAVQAELPKDRFDEVRDNPKYFIVDRKMSRFAGIISVVPALVFIRLFPQYVFAFFVLEAFFIGYSFFETFIYDQSNPWVDLATKERSEDSK